MLLNIVNAKQINVTERDNQGDCRYRVITSIVTIFVVYFT